MTMTAAKVNIDEPITIVIVIVRTRDGLVIRQSRNGIYLVALIAIC